MPSQMAVSFVARFGPGCAWFAIVCLGGVPTGSVEAKKDDCCDGVRRLGDASALARAVVRGDARTVAFLLHAAPNVKPNDNGSSWRMNRLKTRAEVEQWAHSKLAQTTKQVRPKKEPIVMQPTGSALDAWRQANAGVC